ncbi:MAG: site-specific DNA-methyltransferase [Planctomycetes bacterium]|nr:site-specific DNA-methyltransferase [Planctomycetota bacterium]
MMGKNNYQDWTKEDLIQEIKRLKKRKKYGLVWEEEKTKERFEAEAEAEGKLPVLVEDRKREIITDADKPVNILIEGDNYHALSVLNYTHPKGIDVIYIDPPYNTGAKDWKYNNDYVDENDAYRHSKWLSMMNNRLRLAKKLLKDDGVLICAIDENERDRLGLLLEELFGNHEIHCITIVHNPRGVQGKNFSYTHEYAFFVFRKNLKVIGARRIKDEDIYWSNLRNWGGESKREDARNCFYPVIVENEKIVGFGEVVPQDIHPEKQTLKSGNQYYVYPIDKNGIERKWRYARQSVEEIIDLLRAKKTRSGFEIELGKDFGTVRTVWQDSRYDANEYGTKLVHNLVPDTHFDFPKSVFNTYDCIAPILYERKKAIVLDYFAGSGTTGHALMLLNKEDGGQRQFILCTNNENGIAQEVCYPRIRKVIKGHEDYPDITNISSNLKYYKTAFVGSEPTHRNKKLLTDKSVEMLCIRENTFEEVLNKSVPAGFNQGKAFRIFKNKEQYLAILFDEMQIDAFKKEVGKLKLHVSVYVFSLEGDDFREEFEDLKNKITLCSIPEAILKVYRRIFR